MTVSHELSDDQGAFFDVQLVGNGLTDPGSYAVTKELIAPLDTEPTGAVLPELDVAEPDVIQAIRASVVQRNRSMAQTGKHSPLQRDGSYLQVRRGDFLPGYGVVYDPTDRQAVDQARYLEANRNKKTR